MAASSSVADANAGSSPRGVVSSGVAGVLSGFGAMASGGTLEGEDGEEREEDVDWRAFGGDGLVSCRVGVPWADVADRLDAIEPLTVDALLDRDCGRLRAGDAEGFFAGGGDAATV